MRQGLEHSAKIDRLQTRKPSVANNRTFPIVAEVEANRAAADSVRRLPEFELRAEIASNHVVGKGGMKKRGPPPQTGLRPSYPLTFGGSPLPGE